MINMSIEFAHKMSLAYSATCKTLCRELKLPQTAFDILMFLANNPDYKTASDIVEVRKIKANLVSVNVEKLVREQTTFSDLNHPAGRRIHPVRDGDHRPILTYPL